MSFLKPFPHTLFLTDPQESGDTAFMLHVPPQFLAKTWTFPPPATLTHTHVEQYGDLHLFWPHFNIKVLSLPGNSPLLCTHAAAVHASVSFPLGQRRAAGWKDTALLQVVVGRSREYFCWHDTTSRFSPGNRSIRAMKDGQNLLDPGRTGPCSSGAPKQPQRCPRQQVLGPDLAKQTGTR